MTQTDTVSYLKGLGEVLLKIEATDRPGKSLPLEEGFETAIQTGAGSQAQRRPAPRRAAERGERDAARPTGIAPDQMDQIEAEPVRPGYRRCR